jgi:sulfate adenylyltransferase subunit 1 (EFTu-like GTPase family)
VLTMVNQALSTGEQNDLRTENRQMAAEIERMKGQIEMLEAQQNSDWAQGRTDEPPSYLTSIASQHP